MTQGTPFKKSSLCEGCPAFYDPCLDSGAGDDPAHILVVGSAPSGFSVGNRQPFFGREGRLFKDMLNTIKQYQGGKYKDVKVYYTYAVKAGAYEPKAGHLSHCQVNLHRDINRIRGVLPKRNPVIIPLGPVAAKSVGVKMRRIVDVVGREMTVMLADSSPQGYRKLTVVPLLSMKHVLAKLGTANVVMSALLHAVQLACDPEVKPKSLDDVTKDYVFPQTIEEVKNLVDTVINYYNPERGAGPQDWFISLDTETNTLRPYSHADPKTLMLSVAWDDGKSASILLDHPESPYDLKEAWSHVERLLRCPKPKVLHNWKFDHKFLETHQNIRVNNVAWDTMLGEHFIDEDKKGHYRLKQLVPLYAPEYQGYDETLQNFLRGKEEDEERSVEVEDVPEEPDYPPLYLTDNELSDYIVYVSVNGINTGRPDDDWDKLAQAAATKDTTQKIKAKERTEEQLKQLKTARAAIKSLRKQMNIVAPKKESAPKKKVVGSADEGFQHIPLETLRKYAAADADVTRLILKSQTVRLHNTGLYEEGTGVMKSLYLPGSRTLSDMEYRGFAVNQEYLENTIFAVGKRLAEAEAYMHAKFDPALNLNSPKQISAYMGKLNFASLDSGDTGSTGRDTLDQYMEKYAEDDPRHQFCLQLLEFREFHKTLNTYLKPIRRFSKADGKVHCGFNLNGTATGRLCVSGDTQLDTSIGQIAIADLPEKLLPNVWIKTHRGRYRRILRKFFKGYEAMFRVTTAQGNSIVCTRGHRFLTPDGWRHLYDIQEKACIAVDPLSSNFTATNSSIGPSTERAPDDFARRRICGVCNSAGADARTVAPPARPDCELAHVERVNGVLQNQVRQGDSTTEARALLQRTEGQPARTKVATSHSLAEREVTDAVGTRIRCVRDSYHVGNVGLVCARKREASSLENKQAVAVQNTRHRPGAHATIGDVGTGHHRVCRELLSGPTRLLQQPLLGIHPTERTGMVCQGIQKAARTLYREKHHTPRPHLLVHQPCGTSAFDGFVGEENCTSSPSSCAQEYPGRLPISRYQASRGGGWRISPEGHCHKETRPPTRNVAQGAEVPSAALLGCRSLHATPSSSPPYTTSTIRSIEPVGVRGVWDIEVEEDHSYVAQGFVNHNSSSKPNMQNIPLYAARRTKEGADGKEIVIHPGYNVKKLFVPSKPGNIIVNVDIKGAEIRVYTAYAHDEAMIDSLNKGIDTHSWVTSMVYKDKLTYDQIQAGKETDPTIKKWRTNCKKVFFSTLYGGSEYKIRQLINSTLKYARDLQQSIYTSLPKMRAYVDDVARQVRNRRMLKTYFGRCRRFRLAHVTSEMMAEAIREGTNFLIQSTSSDLVLSQLCEIDEHIHELDAELLITVHDSLTFEMPDNNVSLLFPFLDHWITQRVKERFPWLPVDFLYDVEIGPSYGELKPLKRPKKEATC